MDLGVALTVFALILVAEIPDKTMIAMLIMGSRNRPLWVWLGAVTAFTVHVGVAVAVGHLIKRLPHNWVEGVTALIFAAGAAYLLLVPEKTAEEAGKEEAGKEEADRAGRALKTFGASFAVIIVGELGDLTQILTANMAAKYHSALSVFVGALAGLAAASAIGVFGGKALLRVMPLSAIRKGGGVLLAGFAVYTLVTLLTG